MSTEAKPTQDTAPVEHEILKSRVLARSDGIDECDSVFQIDLPSFPETNDKKLNRGISRATDNVNIVMRARTELDNVNEDNIVIEIPVHTFILPDFSSFQDDFRTFLEKDLMALSTLTSLEQANRLNWWTNFAQKLWPLSTSGDGNCLLHAASLGMYGFHDRRLFLRKALHTFLTENPTIDALWRRWKKQQSALNAQAGLVYSEIEWRREWNAIVSMASITPRLRRQSFAGNDSGDLSGAVYESLEEIHVLALAHVLKRPIIVVADTILKDMNGDALAPIPFGGIYLPLEIPSHECHRSPLLLAYDGGHFSALVVMDNSSLPAAIPLTDSAHDLLPIQFSIDPIHLGEENIDYELECAEKLDLLNKYLDIVKLDPLITEHTEKNGVFGSLSKTVSQKLRRKLNRSDSQKGSNSTKTNSTSSGSNPNKTNQMYLCALLLTDKRYEYYDVLIKNYLQSARSRFEEINNKSRNEDHSARYGAGKSQFYTEVDQESHEKISQLTTVKPVVNNDPTVYLSKSTFYGISQYCRAKDCTFFGNPATQNYCSACYRNMVLAITKPV